MAGLTLAQCYADSFCRQTSNLTCYGPGWFTEFCGHWRAFDPGAPSTDLPMPPTVHPPVIDTTPGSPTYGQATVNGEVVATPEQAAILLNQQIAQQDAEWKAANAGAISRTAAGQCAALDCGPFTSPAPDCSACEFDWTKPLVIAGLFGLMALLIAMKK